MGTDTNCWTDTVRRTYVGTSRRYLCNMAKASIVSAQTETLHRDNARLCCKDSWRLFDGVVFDGMCFDKHAVRLGNEPETTQSVELKWLANTPVAEVGHQRADVTTNDSR